MNEKDFKEKKMKEAEERKEKMKIVKRTARKKFATLIFECNSCGLSEEEIKNIFESTLKE